MIPRRILAALPLMLALACTSVPSFAQAMPTPVSAASSPAVAVSWTTIVTTAIGVLVGFCVTGFQTGKLFGFVTLPRPVVPWLGVAATFLQAAGASLGQSGPVTGSSLALACMLGLLALAGMGGGAGLQHAMTAHQSSRGVAAIAAARLRGGGGGGSLKAPGLQRDLDAFRAPQLEDVALPSYSRARTALAIARARRRPLMTRATIALALGTFVMAPLAAGCTHGVLDPHTQVIIDDSIRLAQCMEDVFATDMQAGKPAPEIAIDEGMSCGVDVAKVVSDFGASPAPGKRAVAAAAQANAGAVHEAAMKYQARHPAARP